MSYADLLASMCKLYAKLERKDCNSGLAFYGSNLNDVLLDATPRLWLPHVGAGERHNC